MSVKSELDSFGKHLETESKKNLTRKGKRDRDKLYNSLGFETKESKNSFEFSFFMEDYGVFVDKGVKGKTSSNKAPTSPFKFGSGTGKKGGLTNGISGWVKRKRIQFRDVNTGKFMSYKNTTFLIVRSIYNKGLETTNFYSRPFELGFKRLPDDLTEAYGLDLEKFLEASLR